MYLVTQNEEVPGGTADIALNSNLGGGGGNGRDFIPEELKSQLSEGRAIQKRKFTYTLLNSAEFATYAPDSVFGAQQVKQTVGNTEYAHYINSGAHTSST